MIKQIGLPLRSRLILLITRMITDRTGLHSVLLPLQIRDCSETLNLRKRLFIVREKFKTNRRIRTIFSLI